MIKLVYQPEHAISIYRCALSLPLLCLTQTPKYPSNPNPYLLVPVVGSQLSLTPVSLSVSIPVVLLNLQSLPQEFQIVTRDDEGHEAYHAKVGDDNDQHLLLGQKEKC